MPKRERPPGRHRPSVDPLECRLLLTAVSEIGALRPRLEAAEFAAVATPHATLARPNRVSASLAILTGRADNDEAQDQAAVPYRVGPANSFQHSGLTASNHPQSSGTHARVEISQQLEHFARSAMHAQNTNAALLATSLDSTDSEPGVGTNETEGASRRITVNLDGGQFYSPNMLEREAGSPSPNVEIVVPEPVEAVVAPRGSEIISEFLPLNPASVEEAVEQFLGQLEDLGARLPSLGEPGQFLSEPAVWVVTVAILEFARRRMKSSAGDNRQKRTPGTSHPRMVGAS